MGDRRQIIFTYEEDKNIYFYSHWYGYKLISLLRDQLKVSRDRWDDDSYLSRRIITGIVHSVKECEELTGWGISPYSMDGGPNDIFINLEKQSIKIGDREMTFEEFCETKGD